jgi:hypothetical protein
VTMPYADSWWAINREPFEAPRLYYSTAHYIKEVTRDNRDGSYWYKAFDHLYNAYYYIRPEDIHLMTEDELAPISPGIRQDDKHIAVCLDQQVALAFEGETLVFMARVATGGKNYETPTGSFTTFHKRPSAHMVGGDGVASLYDLVGVPWDTYITENGISFHGTFWHNDYGSPRSHGCINLRPQDALWIYRWTQPAVPSGERLIYQPGSGTRVEIVPTYSPNLKRKA